MIMHAPRCQRQRSPARRAVLVRPPSAAGSRSLTLLLPLASRGSPRTTHEGVAQHVQAVLGVCQRQAMPLYCTSIGRAATLSNRRAPSAAAAGGRQSFSGVLCQRAGGADASSNRRKRPLYSRFALQLFLQRKRVVERSTAHTPCPAPAVELYSALQLYSALHSTALQPLHSTALYNPPLQPTPIVYRS